MMKNFLSTSLVLFNLLCFAQRDPEAKRIGDFSLSTGIGYNHQQTPYLLNIKDVNKYSEKSFMYFGKFHALRQPYWKKLKKTFEGPELALPLNMIPLGENVFMDQTEIANIHYQEFLQFVNVDSGLQVMSKYIPGLDINEMNNYFLNPEFYFYPVIGISYEKASAFCLWRSRILNYNAAEYLAEISDNHEQVIYNGGTFKFVGRLPYEKEWMRFAQYSLNEIDTLLVNTDKKMIDYFKYDRAQDYNQNQKMLSTDRSIKLLSVNLKQNNQLELSVPSYILSFKPSTIGFYNLIGNVMELTQEGFLKGGDFQTTFNQNLVKYRFKMDGESSIGFRCACEVYNNKG